MPLRRFIAAALALALVLGQGAQAIAQEAEASGGAVSEEGSVVEGAGGGLNIGQGTIWLGVGALLAAGLVLSLASDNSASSATGTSGTTGTAGTSGSN